MLSHNRWDRSKLAGRKSPLASDFLSPATHSLFLPRCNVRSPGIVPCKSMFIFEAPSFDVTVLFLNHIHRRFSRSVWAVNVAEYVGVVVRRFEVDLTRSRVQMVCSKVVCVKNAVNGCNKQQPVKLVSERGFFRSSPSHRCSIADHTTIMSWS